MKRKILKFVENLNKTPVSLEQIFKEFSQINKNKIKKDLNSLLEDKKLIKIKNFYKSLKMLNWDFAEITKDCEKFLIATDLKKKSEFLIPKKSSKGALLYDLVFVSKINSKNKLEKNLTKAKVEQIYKKTEKSFIAIVVKKNKELLLKPDSYSKSLFKIKKSDKKNLKQNDRVVAKVEKRDKSYEKIVCSIVSNLKSCKKAINTVNSILISQGINLKFSKEIEEKSKQLEEKKAKNLKNRLNLTKELIFTIDSKSAKDLDDAVSIKKFKTHYVLGVHIADVSHYVKEKDLIDTEAFKRGNSIYFADKVIPMLPKALSNNLCSLNPLEKKLAFSVFLKIDLLGNVLDFKFKKTIISSKIKGVYEEINDIFLKKENSKYYEKYKKFLKSLKLMLELFKILNKNKIKRGCLEIKTTESKISLNKQEKAVKVVKSPEGISQNIIEEFMILANIAAATVAKKNSLPFLYRVHKPPKMLKINLLKNLLTKLKVKDNVLKNKITSKNLQNLLTKHKDTELFSLLNALVLRSMEKAEYLEKSSNHFGLALKNYCHFTSPIRRYSDLLVHRILKDFLFKDISKKELKNKYKDLTKKAASQTSKTEKKAVLIERSCSSCFKAEFMQKKINQKFKATISFIIDRGIFVTLKNTIEGFVSAKSLKGFEFCEDLSFVSKKLQKSYKIGQTVEVVCTNVNIYLGKIDFSIVNQK